MNQPTGFVFKELLIAFIVLASLGAIAFPAYHDYMRRDYYKEVVEATTPFKVAVDKCFKKLKTFTGCHAGTHLIPAPIQAPKGALASLTVINGIITAAPVTHDGILATDTYVLTPKIVNDELTWTPSGKALERGYTG